MDERDAARTPDATGIRDGRWLILLLAIVLALRGWLFVRAEATARDGIGFMRYALRFDDMPWGEVVRSQHQHPGYAFAIWLASKPIRAVWGTSPETLQAAAMLVSLISATLLAAMMFAVGRRLWGTFAGFWGALAFQLLPVSGHHLSDGISDGFFMLWTTAAFALFLRGFASRRPLDFAGAGACIGAAYLTRPEGLLVAVAFAIYWCGLQVARDTRVGWRSWWTCGASAGLACAAVASIYVATTGAITLKPTPTQMLDASVEAPVKGPLFAAHFTPQASRAAQLRAAMRALLFEFCQALQYVGFAFGLGMLLFRGRELSRPRGCWLLAIYFALHAAALVRLGMKASYLSDRHVMPLTLIGVFPCVLGVRVFAETIWGAASWAYSGVWASLPKRMAEAALVALLAVGAFKTLAPLHANRAGNRAAGEWLAERVALGDLVVDEHGWSLFFAGQLFREGRDTHLPAEAQPKCYHVVTRSSEAGVRERREATERDLAKRSELVYHWPADRPVERARIVVYAGSRDPVAQPWGLAPPTVAVPVSRPK